MNFFDKFETIIREDHLICMGDKILVAVSGGIDSVTLLDVLYKIKDRYGLGLRVIHVNHCLRGAEADRDQQFVEELAQNYGLPIAVKKVDVKKFSAANKYSIEEAARMLRYQFFNEELVRTGYDWVALGHNADDQAETILDHLLRGSGVSGLAGMRAKRDRFIRPLLAFPRNDIETYVKNAGLNYVTDSTNNELTYRRNKIRHQLIPYLKDEFNPAINTGLKNTATIFTEVDIFLVAEAEKAYLRCLKSHKKNKIILDINLFFSYFNILQIYILRHISNSILSIESNLNFTRTQAFRSYVKNRKRGSKFLINDEWHLLIDHDELVLRKNETHEFEYIISLDNTYKIFDGEKIFRAELITRKQLPQRFYKNNKVEYADFSKITGPLKLRNFRAGDRFIPLNMKGHKKVSDFFTDNKVPLHQRDEIPLLTCEKGIIWIIGWQIDDRFKVTEDSERILKMEIKND